MIIKTSIYYQDTEKCLSAIWYTGRIHTLFVHQNFNIMLTFNDLIKNEVYIQVDFKINITKYPKWFTK